MLVILMSDRTSLTARENAAIAEFGEVFASALSLMELRIKVRAERRRGSSPSVPSPADALTFCAAHRIGIFPFTAADAAVPLDDDPPHGDSFDELLLAHTQALQARLLTRDSKLRKHPLAYQA